MSRKRRDPYKLQRLRNVVQIVFLFVFAFLLVKALFGQVLGSTVPLLIFTLITAILTLVLGRVWCGWVCPVNTVLDRIHFKGAVERGARLSEGWRTVKYVLLLLTLVIVILPDGPGNPTQGSAQLSNQNLFIGGLVIFALGGIVGLDAIAEHFFCRYLCPLGGAVALLSKVAPMHRIVRNHCNDCSVCVDACPVGIIDPHLGFTSDPSECTVCLDCMTVCTSSSNGFSFRRHTPDERKIIVPPPSLTEVQQ
jgi:polyferredoxin